MKNSLLLLIFFLPGILLSQSLSIFDVDTSNFPSIRAKFFAFDAEGKQIKPTPNELLVTENGENRQILNINCPLSNPERLSVVLLVDVTGYNDIDNAKNVLNSWVDMLGLGVNEVALVSFDAQNYINQDFTTDKNQIQSAINNLQTLSKTENHLAALIRPVTGGISVAEKGKYNKVILFLSSCSHFEKESIQSIIQKANQSRTTLNFVIFDLYDRTPDLCKEMSLKTGGFSIHGIHYNDLITAKNALQNIYQIAQGGLPCEIEWESDIACNVGNTSVELKLIQSNISVVTNYKIPIEKLAIPEFNPTFVKFLDPEIGIKVDEKVTVTARNADFTISNIKSSNSTFTITPTNFVLNEGESRELTISYTPTDSGFNYSRFEIESLPCPMAFYASGGYKGKQPSVQTLKLTHPNGGETFVVGSDTLITWEGIPPSDTVGLEYSIDNGQNWQTITKNASGLKYKWTNIPRPTSEKCLVRVSQGNGFDTSASNNFTPKIEWKKTYGGSSEDEAHSIQQTSDDGFIVVGHTASKNGDITENKGPFDVWVLKLDMDGNLEWQKTYGGSGHDRAYFIQETSNGGYIVAGSTRSNDGDITVNKGEYDVWILKISVDGSLEWQKTFGGSSFDGAHSIQETIDGGYIISALTRSSDGDVTSINGNVDLWVIKIDINGNMEWQKTYGGSGSENNSSLQETSDGGYIVVATTNSIDGDITENKGKYDAWVLKLNFEGRIEWQKTYGGIENDALVSIDQASDGSYIVAGRTSSNFDDVTKNKGGVDVWVLKIRIDGTIEWQKTYGGSEWDGASSIQVTRDGGYIVTYETFSNDRDGTENKEQIDAWVLKLRFDGSIEWQKTFGGSGRDYLKSIKETRDGGFIFAVYSWSADGDITENKGSYDVWVVKLAATTILQSDVSDAVFSIVEPMASSRDIDMEKVLVGSTKDSVVTEFVSNIGSWKFRVDSIYIRGADASAFSLVAGFPKYTIEPNDNYFGEFRFVPNRVGIHSAEIVIVTQAETLVQSIVGEGVEPRLEVITDFLDFGLVEIGSERTISDTVLIKNISISPITVDNVVQLGPDMSQFKVISGGGSFTLMPNEERAMTLMFQPIFGGRTSGQIGFVYDGTGSPAVAQLFGAGIGGLVYISNDSAYAGEKRTLSLMMSKVKPEGIASIASNFEATIRFQRTILYPENPSSINFVNDSIYITINGTIGNSLEIAEIPVIAGLGIVEETLVDIVDMKLKDNNGNYVEYDFEKQSGTFKLLGICYDGGTRLFNPNNKVGIERVSPNPAENMLEVDLQLAEEGQTELLIYNMQGEKVKELFKQNVGSLGAKSLKSDISDLSSGQYYLVLITPTYIATKNLIILR